MIVCLDTNVLVSALIWKGIPLKILTAWLDQDYDLALSDTIFEEYREIFARFAHLTSESHLSTWLKKIREDAIFYDTSPFLQSWSRDPDDDEFIACALASEADFLVTGDKDLLVLNGQFSFPIIKPKNFLENLKTY